MKRAIYRFCFDCREGVIHALFIAEMQHIDMLLNADFEFELDFGSPFGRYSDVCFQPKSEHFILVSDLPEIVSILEKLDIFSGQNPLKNTFVSSWLPEEFEGRGWTDVTFLDWCNWRLHGTIPKYYREEGLLLS